MESLKVCALEKFSDTSMKGQLKKALEEKKDQMDRDAFSRGEALISEIDDLGIFDERERKGIWNANWENQVKILFEGLNRHLINREPQIKAVLISLIQRIAGSRMARTPLLIGPPGTGKSYLPEALKDVLTRDLNIKTVISRLWSSSDYLGLEELNMEIFGSSIHYANGMPSPITMEAVKKENRLIIVVFDEVEKSLPSSRALLLKLLDPDQPLEDIFLKGILSSYEHDRRFKIFTILTANSIENLQVIPELWDRIVPVYFEPYNKDQLTEIAYNKGAELCSSIVTSFFESNQIDKDFVAKVIKNLEQAGEEVTLRRLLATLDCELIMKKLPFLNRAKTTKKLPPAKFKMGFQSAKNGCRKFKGFTKTI